MNKPHAKLALIDLPMYHVVNMETDTIAASYHTSEKAYDAAVDFAWNLDLGSDANFEVQFGWDIYEALR